MKQDIKIKFGFELVAIKGRPGVKGFPERLKCVREIRKKTQSELGLLTGLAETVISNYENERRTPNIDHLRSLCVALNVSADYFLDCH